MELLLNTVYLVQQLGDAGGPVLWLIAGMMVLMWLLLLERFIYYRIALRSDIADMLETWLSRDDRHSRRARHVREALLSQIHMRIDRFLPMIKTLVVLAPLLGLLGTVTGMVTVFDALSMAEGGGARAMSSGVSRATIPTMAGMVAALSGLAGLTLAERLALREKTQLAIRMTGPA